MFNAELRKIDDDEFVSFFIFCFTILMFFHLMFGVIIVRYLRFLADRPKQKENKMFVDKNLNDLILNSADNIIIS